MPLNWENITLKLSHCGHVRCEENWRLDERWSASLQDCDLWLAWAGRGEMLLDGKPVPLHPGVCLLMRPGHLYVARHFPPERLGVTYLHFELFDRRGRRIPRELLPPIVHHVPDLVYFQAVARRVSDLSRGTEQQRAAACGLLKGLLIDLASRTGQAAGPSEAERMVMQLAGQIREDPSRRWGIARMAEQAGYCADHFARLFAAVHGQTPRDFVVAARIERAQTLLAETDMSVKQIAAALRYSSVYFFSRQFHQRTGMPPSRWRGVT
jgi:AraC-like DNA-binding protein